MENPAISIDIDIDCYCKEQIDTVVISTVNSVCVLIGNVSLYQTSLHQEAVVGHYMRCCLCFSNSRIRYICIDNDILTK